MGPLVADKVMLLDKALAAFLTGERTFTRVDLLMSPQVLSFSKPLAAVLALMWLFSAVQLLVEL